MPTSLKTILLVALGVVSARSDAELIAYTNRSDWEAAVGAGVGTEDFNSFQTSVPFHTTPLDTGAFTLSMTASATSRRNHIDLPPVQFPGLNADGTAAASVLTSLGVSLFVTFDFPVTAFGADFGALNDGVLRTNIYVGADTLTPAVTADDQVRFVGFTSKVPFTVVEFRGAQNDGFGIDNVAYSPAAPEPGAALLAISALCCALTRRRRV